MTKVKYKSDIRLGKRYRDDQTGTIGVATAVSFYQHACERVVIEAVVNGDLREFVFDAPRLTCIETEKTARTDRPGGPRSMAVQHRMPR